MNSSPAIHRYPSRSRPLCQGPVPATSDPLRSVHTAGFPEILAQFGISVLVTTYQAGRLVILRNEGGVLNTHFRMFPKPMGLAARPQSAGDRLRNGDPRVSQRTRRCRQDRTVRKARRGLHAADGPRDGRRADP